MTTDNRSIHWRRAEPFALLCLRVALATPFLRSGLTKWDGFGRLSDTTVYLFQEEFRLHLFGRLVPYPLPTLMAWSSAVAEIALPLLLLAGLATRWAALGLLAMTAIIQLTIPDGWANFHLAWAAMAMALVSWGGGTWAADAILPHRGLRGVG